MRERHQRSLSIAIENPHRKFGSVSECDAKIFALDPVRSDGGDISVQVERRSEASSWKCMGRSSKDDLPPTWLGCEAGYARKGPRRHKNFRKTFGVSKHAQDFSTAVDIPGKCASESIVVHTAREAAREDLQRRPAAPFGEADSAEGGYMCPKARLFGTKGPSCRVSPRGGKGHKKETESFLDFEERSVVSKEWRWQAVELLSSAPTPAGGLAPCKQAVTAASSSPLVHFKGNARL
jgi:hypothetical protein